MIAAPLLLGSAAFAMWSVLLAGLLIVSLATFRYEKPFLFVLGAGGLGLTAGIALATSTSWGIAPSIACALCGLGASYLGGPVLRFRSSSKEPSGDAPEEDAIAHKALSGLLSSLLTFLAVLVSASLVITLLSLNFGLGGLNIAGLAILSAVAIVAATALMLSMRAGVEKT